jgi:class 3 adenylate cyclase
MSTQENIKYVFIDIVGFSHERTVEAQTRIINSLNEIVLTSISALSINRKKVIFLPTGDGICISLLGIPKPFDLPLLLALEMLRKVDSWNKTQETEMNRFKIRVGVNENIDNVIIDINGKKNVSGSGINYAQRVMNIADGNQILLGFSSYEKICDREQYYNKFIEYEAVVKHGKQLKVFQYIDRDIDYLDCSTPTKFAEKTSIRLRPTRALGIYGCIIKNYYPLISKLSRDSGGLNISLHIALIYASKRLNEKLHATDFHVEDHYDEFDKYFIDGQIELSKWISDINNFSIVGRIDLERKLMEDFLKKYEYYFQADSDYFILSNDGNNYQQTHFSNLDISKLINK